MRAKLAGFGQAALVLVLVCGLWGAEKTFKDTSVQVGDIKIHYLEAGTGDRHMVFIPGLTMTAEVWKEQLPYFAARDFHVIALDPRSHGQSSKTEGGNTYQQHAADLHAFLQKMKLEHCTLVGWGAGVVTLLEYVSSPEALKPDALVLVGDPPIVAGDKEIPTSFNVQQSRDFVLAMEEDRAKATEAMVRGFFKAPQNIFLLKSLNDASLKTPAGAAIALLFDLVTGDRRPALSRIVVSTLVIVPQDRQLAGEYLQSKIAGAKLKVIPDAGHALFLEKPQAFNQALEDFLGIR
jgi:pimeloyl-ACP methyl ester carboxylesterase